MIKDGLRSPAVAVAFDQRLVSLFRRLDLDLRQILHVHHLGAILAQLPGRWRTGLTPRIQYGLEGRKGEGVEWVKVVRRGERSVRNDRQKQWMKFANANNTLSSPCSSYSPPPVNHKRSYCKSRSNLRSRETILINFFPLRDMYDKFIETTDGRINSFRC